MSLNGCIENKPQEVACIGDSITYGYGVNKKDSWVYKINEKTKNKYILNNYGICGQRMQDMNWNQEIDEDICLILLGTNDAFSWDEQAFQKSVDVGLQSLKGKKIFVLLPPAIVQDEYYDLILKEKIIPVLKKMAEKYHLETIDLYSLTEGHSEYYSDGLHLNKEGNEVVAKEIIRYLR